MCHLITLRHTTPRQNLSSISRTGLDTAYHQCPLPEIWLHSKSKSAWAILHTAKRHKVPAEDIAIITVRVPRRWLCRKWRGIWTVPHSIPPERIVSVNPRAAVAVAVA